MEKPYLDPVEIAEKYIETGHKKTNMPVYRLLLLAFLAGAFIAFAAEGSNAAIHTVQSVGIAKTLAGALFAVGLMMVVITGAELFTGNMLIIVSCLEGRSKWTGLLKNWFFVYCGNFIGALTVVIFILLSGQFNFSDGLLGGFTIKTAAYKAELPFFGAFFMGLLCNWLVCLAVWMASAAKDITGKLLSVFFPIWLFITSGFEHSIANMYYIPAGILAKGNPGWADAAASLGVTAAKLDALNWYSFLAGNLLPVTLGNIAGGTLFTGAIYWLSFLYKKRKKRNSRDIKNTAEDGIIKIKDIVNQ